MYRFLRHGQCRSARQFARPFGRTPTCAFAIFCLVAAACTSPASGDSTAASGVAAQYELAFEVIPNPGDGTARVVARVAQQSPLLLELSMSMPAEYFSDISGDGSVQRTEDRVIWEVPDGGGELTWLASVVREKGRDTFDAYMTDDWAMFRGSDIIPPAATRTESGATSATTIEFDLPSGWSSVTQYPGENHRYTVDNPDRRFDRPTGWILLGVIGTRNESIAGTRVSIAGPQGQNIRRMDMLAFLRWTMPEVARVFPEFPERFTVFSAGEPMWRGGLSAPLSAYLHASRPLLSENGTSTLLHEIMHVGMGVRAAPGHDWIVEGLAEYYSLLILRRSDTIGRNRYETAIEKLADWANDADSLCGNSASGAVTAKAVGLFRDLNLEIRRATNQQASLDDVIDALTQIDAPISIDDLRHAAEQLLGEPSDTLRLAELDNCTI